MSETDLKTDSDHEEPHHIIKELRPHRRYYRQGVNYFTFGFSSSESNRDGHCNVNVRPHKVR